MLKSSINASPLGKELVEYLKDTDYNTTIPSGIKGVKTAHKVGMFPLLNIYNDVGIIYDANPFALAIMTKEIPYVKSQKVIADLAAIVYKHHKNMASAQYIKSKADVPVYQNTSNRTIQGLLKSGATFKFASSQGPWYEIHIGKRTGYVEKKWFIGVVTPSVSTFSKMEQGPGIIRMNQNAIVLNSTSTITGIELGVIYKNQESYYSEEVGDFYAIDFGGRVGSVNKKYVVVSDTK
jgi:hypothetical protein